MPGQRPTARHRTWAKTGLSGLGLAAPGPEAHARGGPARPPGGPAAARDEDREEERGMESRLDAVAKAVARGSTRRAALRRVGGGLAGGALAALGPGHAAVRAQGEECPECRHCIKRFFGDCITICEQHSHPAHKADCPLACCEGARATCAVLGHCTPECFTPCRTNQAP